MSQPSFGSIELYDRAVPAIGGGLHSVTSTVVVDSGIAPPPLDHAVHRDFLQIGTSGLQLQPTDILSCHPPRNGTGAYDEELPHVVLGDRTVPWERTGPGGGTWLALLVFADTEVSFATAPLTTVVGSAAAAAIVAEEADSHAGAFPVDAVQVHDPAVLRAVLPTRAELDLLTHLRRVNTADTTLDLADDDGWLAVVVANRLPLAGPQPMHYHACLVSVEHREDLYAQPDTSSLVLLYRWDFITDTGGTFAELAEHLDVGTLGQTADGGDARGRASAPRVGREGVADTATYRGPFTVEGAALPDGELGDVSYDAAYELGRLLAAADGPLTRDLVEWHRAAAAGASAAVHRAAIHEVARHHAAVTLEPEAQPLHAMAAAAGLSVLLDSLAPRAPHRARRTGTTTGTTSTTSTTNGSTNGTEARTGRPDRPEAPMSEHTFAAHGGALLTALIPPVAAAGQVRSAGQAAAGTQTGQAADVPLPDYVADYLVKLRLGEGIPFNYLVPDPAFLPDGSIRFFTVDDAWLDAITSGVMAVGTAGTRDTDHVSTALPALLAAAREAVPLVGEVRRRRLGRNELITHVRNAVARADDLRADRTAVVGEAGAVGATDGSAVTGFLLRSGLVSGWPGFSVRAFTTTAIPDQADPSQVDPSLVVPILRMDLLAPSILLVLFGGTPALVWLEEPHHGIQLGVDPSQSAGSYQIDLVGPTGSEVTTSDPHGETVPKTAAVAMRSGAGSGVIDIGTLQATLAAAHAADSRVAPQGGSAALALQLLRPPVRQRFSVDENPH